MALADIDFETAATAAQDITAKYGGGTAIAVAVDVSQQARIEAGVAETTGQLGDIDILVDNAAVFTAAPIIEIDRPDHERVFAINMAGTLFTLQTVALQMVAQGRQR